VFVLPVFLQGTLHMTAWQTGIIILPGALATAVSMALSGKISRVLDARVLVASGSVFFFASMWMLAQITSQSGAGDFFWPLILRGLGLGIVFVPLTTITLSGLDLKEIPQATGVSNFFRQLGGSLGIALMATLLTHFTQQGRAVLVTHVSWYDFATRTRLDQLARAFVGRGADALTAQGRALTVVQGQVMQQASILAFSRLYLLSGLLLVAAMPLLLLIGKPRLGAGRPGPMAAE
jgi:DHA2 family multidrug resistance protein